MFQKASKLRGISTKPVYIPEVELNRKLIKGIYHSTLDLKNELKQCIRQLQEPTPSSGDLSSPLWNPVTRWVPSMFWDGRLGHDPEHWVLSFRAPETSALHLEAGGESASS